MNMVVHLNKIILAQILFSGYITVITDTNYQHEYFKCVTKKGNVAGKCLSPSELWFLKRLCHISLKNCMFTSLRRGKAALNTPNTDFKQVSPKDIKLYQSPTTDASFRCTIMRKTNTVGAMNFYRGNNFRRFTRTVCVDPRKLFSRKFSPLLNFQ